MGTSGQNGIRRQTLNEASIMSPADFIGEMSQKSDKQLSTSLDASHAFTAGWTTTRTRECRVAVRAVDVERRCGTMGVGETRLLQARAARSRGALTHRLLDVGKNLVQAADDDHAARHKLLWALRAGQVGEGKGGKGGK